VAARPPASALRTRSATCRTSCVRLAQQRVVEDQPVQVEEGAHFLRRFGRNLVAQRVQFGPNQREGVVQPRDFVQHVLAVDRVLPDLKLAGRQPVRAPDRDAARGADALDLSAHVLACACCCTPLRSRRAGRRQVPRQGAAA